MADGLLPLYFTLLVVASCGTTVYPDLCMRILRRVFKIGEVPKIGWNHGYVFGYLWICMDFLCAP